MLGAPIIRRELAEVLNKRRQYLARSVYLITLFILVLATWPHGEQLTSALLRRSGYRFVLGFTLIQMLGASLLLPPMLAVSLTSEKESKNIHLLILTRMSSLEIVLGKMLSYVGHIALFILFGLPLVLLALNMGSISVSQAIAGELVVLSTILLVAAVAVVVGVTSSKAHNATAANFWVIVVVLAPIAGWWVSKGKLPTILFSPLGAWMGVFGLSSKITLSPFAALLPSLLMSMGLCGASLLWASLRVRRLPELREDTLSEMPHEGIRSTLSESFFRILSGRKLRREPVVWRQMRVSVPEGNIINPIVFYGGLLLVAVLVFCLLYFDLLAALWRGGARGGWMAFEEFLALCAGIGIIGLIVEMTAAPVSAAVQMVQERSSNSLFLVATTPLDAGEILIGKARGLARLFTVLSLPLILFNCVVVFALMIATDSENFGWYMLYGSAVISSVFIMRCLVFQGVGVSMLASGMSNAIARALVVIPAALGMLCGLAGSVSLIGSLVMQFVWGGSPGEATLLAFAICLPVVSVVMAVAGGRYLRNRSGPMLQTFLENTMTTPTEPEEEQPPVSAAPPPPQPAAEGDTPAAPDS